MQGMIKFELKRSFKNRLFLISLLISLALVTWYSIERIPYCVQLNSEFLNDENLMGFFEISYTNWIGSHNIYLQQNIFYMAIPILATLPFGSSFYDDINRGYARNVCVRAKKKYYLIRTILFFSIQMRIYSIFRKITQNGNLLRWNLCKK